MAYPESYRYTKEHEWIEVQGKTAKVGKTMVSTIVKRRRPVACQAHWTFSRSINHG